MSENQGVFHAFVGGGAMGAVIGSAMAAEVEAVLWCLIPLLVWVAHTMVNVIVRELGAYLHAQKKLADERLPIEVHHDPVGIDGSCIRVR